MKYEFTARFAGIKCEKCGEEIRVGEAMTWERMGAGVRRKWHAACLRAKSTQVDAISTQVETKTSETSAPLGWTEVES